MSSGFRKIYSSCHPSVSSFFHSLISFLYYTFYPRTGSDIAKSGECKEGCYSQVGWRKRGGKKTSSWRVWLSGKQRNYSSWASPELLRSLRLLFNLPPAWYIDVKGKKEERFTPTAAAVPEHEETQDLVWGHKLQSLRIAREAVQPLATRIHPSHPLPSSFRSFLLSRQYRTLASFSSSNPATQKQQQRHVLKNLLSWGTAAHPSCRHSFQSLFFVLLHQPHFHLSHSYQNCPGATLSRIFNSKQLRVNLNHMSRNLVCFPLHFNRFSELTPIASWTVVIFFDLLPFYSSLIPPWSVIVVSWTLEES